MQIKSNNPNFNSGPNIGGWSSGFNVNSYKGGFGYKRYIKNNLAVRGAVIFNSSKEKFPWESLGSENKGYTGEDGSNKSFKFGVEVAGEIHRNKGKVDPFYGGGASFTISRDKYTDPVRGMQGSELPKQLIIKNNYPNAWTRISLFGLYGLEYTVNSMLTLGAEYQLWLIFDFYPDEERDYGDGNKDVYKKGSQRYFGISSRGGITLAIYLNR